MDESRETKCRPRGGGGQAVYGLGVIGAAMYFMQHAAGFWEGAFGILRAFVWPAIMIYKLLEILKVKTDFAHAPSTGCGS